MRTPIGPSNTLNLRLKQKNIIELHKTSQNNPKIDLGISTHVHSNPQA